MRQTRDTVKVLAVCCRCWLQLAKMVGPWIMAPRRLPSLHLPPTSYQSRPGGSVPPLWFPRYGALSVVMSLAFRDCCKLKVAWDAWERKITSPRLEPALPKPPPDCRLFV